MLRGPATLNIETTTTTILPRGRSVSPPTRGSTRRRLLPPPCGGNAHSKELPAFPIPSYPALHRQDITYSWSSDGRGPFFQHKRADFEQDVQLTTCVGGYTHRCSEPRIIWLLIEILLETGTMRLQPARDVESLVFILKNPFGK